MAESAPIYDPDQKQPATRPGLKVLEGSGETSPPAGSLSAVAELDDSTSKDTTDPHRVGRGYIPNSQGNRGAISRVMVNRRKTVIFGGATAIISLIVVFFSFILPSFKLPHLQAHLGKRLARSAQTFTRNVTTLTAEKVAVDLTTDAEAKSLLSKSTLGKALNLYDPKAAVRTMKANGSLDFEYDAKGKISGVLIDGRRVPAPKLDFGKFITNRSKWKTFYKDIYTQTDRALLRDGQSYLVRSRVSKAMVSSFGGKLYFWQRKGFDEKGKPSKQVTQDTQLQLFDNVSTPPSETALTNEVDSTAKDALADERTCLSNPACAEKVSSGQLSLLEASGADKKISAFADRYKELASPTSKYGLTASAIYGVGAIVCMAYDGSVETSKAVVDAQNSAAVRTYLAIASAADQQKSGNVTPEAVNGLNNLLGDISNTNPEKLARGQSIDTSSEPYAQSTRIQSYNVFGSGTAANVASGFANYICPKILSDELFGTFVAWQIGSFLIPGLGSVIKNVSEKSATEGVKIIVEQSIKRMFANITARFKGPVERKILANSALRFGVTNGGAIVATESLTYAARMVVLSQMGAFINGADYQNLVNQADMGAVAYNNELDRQQNFGRPLTNQEVALTQQRDKQYLAAQRGHQSLFQQYFAINNPDSSLANMVVKTQGFFAKFHSISAVLEELPKLFVGMARSFASMFIPQARAVAASATDTTNYNMLQWGWSNDENNLIDNDPTYSDPLVNADILENSTEPGQVEQIAKTYGPCFSESMGALLATKPSGSDSFYVSRDSDTGNVTNDGLCSPASLGFDNTSDPLANDKDSKSSHKHDMIFRWRLNQGYQNAMNELTDIQNVQDTSTATSPSPSTTLPPATTKMQNGQYVITATAQDNSNNVVQKSFTVSINN